MVSTERNGGTTFLQFVVSFYCFRINFVLLLTLFFTVLMPSIFSFSFVRDGEPALSGKGPLMQINHRAATIPNSLAFLKIKLRVLFACWVEDSVLLCRDRRDFFAVHFARQHMFIDRLYWISLLLRFQKISMLLSACSGKYCRCDSRDIMCQDDNFCVLLSMAFIVFFSVFMVHYF